jgi:probable F420-dependent oxidoreductase
VSGEAIAELAAAYERLGFGAAYVTDHPAPDDRWLAGGGHQALEPTVALATAAAATRRLLLHTNVYVLPYRNPFLAAKALASLDVVSGGRLIVGVAAGYLRPEFRALGAEFEDRTARLEEALQLLPRIWSESSVAVEGIGFEARGVTAEPRPWQRPHPPIWVGGNTPAAMRRAVRWAQGWSPFPTAGGMETAVRTSAITSIDDLRTALARVREMCEAEGRTSPLTICFIPFSLNDYLRDPVGGLAPMVEEIAELEATGCRCRCRVSPAPRSSTGPPRSPRRSTCIDLPTPSCGEEGSGGEEVVDGGDRRDHGQRVGEDLVAVGGGHADHGVGGHDHPVAEVRCRQAEPEHADVERHAAGDDRRRAERRGRCR